MLITGAKLTPEQRKMVLGAFVLRWTRENSRQTYGGKCPGCVQSEPFPKVTGSKGERRVWERAEWHAYHRPITTDAEWLTSHAFHFTADGTRLSERHSHAEPYYLAQETGGSNGD